MDRTLYLRGHWPTPRVYRLTFDEIVDVLLNTSWKRENDSVLTMAVAIAKAESAGDPLAYLAYLTVPGNPGDPRKYPYPYKIWIDDDDIDYDAGPFKRKIFWNGVRWMRNNIPITNETSKYGSVPELYELPERLQSRPMYSVLPHRRILIVKTAAGRKKADTGLFQLNSQYYPIIWDADANAEMAYQGPFLGRSKQWTAWEAYNGGHHKQYLAAARDAVARAR